MVETSGKSDVFLNMETHFPLNSFLASLAADGIRPSIHDYDQLIVVFQTSGDWTLSRLKNVLIALLAKNEERQEIISRRFDNFFEDEIDDEKKQLEIDIRQIISDLKNFKSKPDPTSSSPEPSPMPDPSSPDHPKKGRKNIISWVFAAMALIAIALFGINKLTKKTEGPALDLSHFVLDFGQKRVDTTEQKKITLTNTGTTPLTILNVNLKGKAAGVFSIPELNFPIIVPVGESFILPATFTPKAEGLYTAELEIIHDAETRSDTIVLKGDGEIDAPPPKDTAIRRRLYPDVPYVKKVSYESLERPTVWKTYAGISGLLFLITIIYGLYLRRLKSGPSDKAPDVNEDAPQYFNAGAIGGKPRPRLDEEALGFIADSMGYFKSRQPGRGLNVPASIRSTVKQGGIPTCKFYRGQRIRTLLILEDAYADALDWNPIAGELADGMIRHGVPVLHGKFRGSPDAFRSPDGSVYHLDDLEDQRRGILLLIQSQSSCFH